MEQTPKNTHFSYDDLDSVVFTEHDSNSSRAMADRFAAKADDGSSINLQITKTKALWFRKNKMVLSLTSDTLYPQGRQCV